jgi:hypothetical protein
MREKCARRRRTAGQRRRRKRRRRRDPRRRDVQGLWLSGWRLARWPPTHLLPRQWRSAATPEWLRTFKLAVDVVVRIRNGEAPGRTIRSAIADLSLVDEKTGALRFPFLHAVPGASWSELLGHTVPTVEAVAHLSDVLRGMRCASVGCGSGLWERLLSDAGLSIVMVDAIFPAWRFDGPRAIRVADTITAHHVPRTVISADALILIWPEPYRVGSNAYSPYGYDSWCLKRFRGDTVVSVTERADRPFGDIGSDAFWTAISDRSSWRCVSTMPLPHYAPDLYFPVLRVHRRVTPSS